MQQRSHLRGVAAGALQVRLPARLGGSELRDQHGRLCRETVPARGQLHGPDSRLQLRLSARIHWQTVPREDRPVLGEPVSERDLRGQPVQPRVHLSSWMDRRGLRDEHQRMLRQTLQEQRPVYRSGGRIYVHLRARLHRQTVSTHHRRLCLGSLPKRRDLRRPVRGIRLQVQTRFRRAAVRGRTGRVSQRPVQPCWNGSLRRLGQHFCLSLSRRV